MRWHILIPTLRGLSRKFKIILNYYSDFETSLNYMNENFILKKNCRKARTEHLNCIDEGSCKCRTLVLCSGMSSGSWHWRAFNAFKNWKRQSQYVRSYKEREGVHVLICRVWKWIKSVEPGWMMVAFLKPTYWRGVCHVGGCWTST